MYSLYRAWFGAAEDSYPLRLSPPDTVVRVGNDGEYHFVAHRAVLAAHSGYLKALLATTTTSSPAAGEAAGDAESPLIASVTVPSSIGGEAFGPLLHYMYTGRLEVTLDNIYTVLLATHLLHMPGALEQCRAALLRLRAPPALPSPSPVTTSSSSTSSQSNSVLRPVPNRLLGPAFCWPQSAANHHLYPPPRHLELPPHLPALQLPPVQQLPAPIIHKTTPYGSKEPSISPVSSASPQARMQGGGLLLQRSPSASPELVVVSSASPAHNLNVDDEHSSSAARGRRSASRASSERISVSDNGSEHQQQQQQQVPREHQQRQARRNRASSQQQHQQKSSRQSSRAARDRSSTSSSSPASAAIQTQPGVIYDVACCDGPVRFHRVLNENYAPSDVAQQPPVIPLPQQQQQQQQQHRVQSPQCNGRACRENEENEHRVPPASQRHSASQPASQPLPAITSSADSENRSYTCGYCQHTFKSQNCYRKHARRHLLPTDATGNEVRQTTTTTATAPAPAPASTQQQQPSEGKKREVRLLDLNVQYYPCKICGSKFPSYYFVHKHRKLHHANVDEPSQRSASDEQKQQQQEQQPSTSENVQQQQTA